MPALQLAQALRPNKRKALAVAAAVLIGGGFAYSQSVRAQRRHIEKRRSENGTTGNAKRNEDKSGQVVKKRNNLLILLRILSERSGSIGYKYLSSLVLIALLKTALSNRLARVQGFLFRAVFLKRVPLFVRLITENVLLCLLQSVFISTTKYVTGNLSLHFRKILTDRVHNDYFQNMAYYKMSHLDRRISNPEQRIASDIPRFCTELCDLIQENIASVFDGLHYTWRLCSYASPKYALGILGYVIGAGVITATLSPPFGRLMSTEQQLEGDYRQLHSRLRTHSESIAFYGGQEREASIIFQKFRALYKHLGSVLYTQWWFGMIQDFLLKYLGATFGVVLIIEPFFAGALKPDQSTLGRAMMLSNMRYHTSVIIALFQSMGTLATSPRRYQRISGYADRIDELMSIARDLRNAGVNAGNNFVEANYIEFEGVAVTTPTGNPLVKDLTLKVEPGSNLLITGPNGSGKSSLFRVLGGLWPLVSGRISKPGVGSSLNHEIFYVPQRPYTSIGTLRDQLIYPLTAEEETHPLTAEGMRELLRNVDLEYLLERYPPSEEVNWGDELSLGEQQRLGMARLFYHKPAFAILDECTSAVTTDMEERFCDQVRDMGTSCVTISHRPALAAFHDTVLSLDGEGGWTVHHERDDTPGYDESDISNAVEARTDMQKDAFFVQKMFLDAKESTKAHDSYVRAVLAVSPPPPPPDSSKVHPVPRLQVKQQKITARVSSLAKILVPTISDKQGGQLLAVALLVISRTWISDRIADLNGTAVKHVLEQDRTAFIRLTGVSVLQSAASSFVAPSLRYLTARLALGWRLRLTQHLSDLYFNNNAFYKVLHLSECTDADQRLTQDTEKLCGDVAGLVTGMVKPLVDIFWFTLRMKTLTGKRGVAFLYAYMLLGLGFLRCITPDFASLTSQEQQLEGAFRYMHSRLRSHAESVAFFGGGLREKTVIEGRFNALLKHGRKLLWKKWTFGVADEFVTKQLPHIVTWGLSLLYAVEHSGNRSVTSVQGELAHDLRFLASVVSQSFLAFGDILELYRKYLELSGGITRISELEELVQAAQHEAKPAPVYPSPDPLKLIEETRISSNQDNNDIVFSEVDIVTPSQKMLARKLTFRIQPDQSMLITGPNGSGKSSLFRVLGGLWPIVSGRVSKPGRITAVKDHLVVTTGLSREIFYVPQRPYTALGTLRDQIIYPLTLNESICKVLIETNKDDPKLALEKYEITEEALELLDGRLGSIIEEVKLVNLLSHYGWNKHVNWEDTLSLGEQQRLGMARLFFHKPTFGILDECTNATSVDVEEALYRHAHALGITIVTISQRPGLIPYHSSELRLVDGEGSWELRSIKSS